MPNKLLSDHIVFPFYIFKKSVPFSVEVLTKYTDSNVTGYFYLTFLSEFVDIIIIN